MAQTVKEDIKTYRKLQRNALQGFCYAFTTELPVTCEHFPEHVTRYRMTTTCIGCVIQFHSLDDLRDFTTHLSEMR